MLADISVLLIWYESRAPPWLPKQTQGVFDKVGACLFTRVCAPFNPLHRVFSGHISNRSLVSKRGPAYCEVLLQVVLKLFHV